MNELRESERERICENDSEGVEKYLREQRKKGNRKAFIRKHCSGRGEQVVINYGQPQMG